MLKAFFKFIKFILFVGFIFFGIKVILDLLDEGDGIYQKEAKDNKTKVKSASKSSSKEPIKVRRESQAKNKTKPTGGSRIDRLYSYMQKVGSADMSDVRKIFPDVTERTLRRDFNKLIDRKLVTKTGNTKSSRYVIS